MEAPVCAFCVCVLCLWEHGLVYMGHMGLFVVQSWCTSAETEHQQFVTTVQGDLTCFNYIRTLSYAEFFLLVCRMCPFIPSPSSTVSIHTGATLMTPNTTSASVSIKGARSPFWPLVFRQPAHTSAAAHIYTHCLWQPDPLQLHIYGFDLQQ